jgi:hypothetical protein
MAGRGRHTGDTNGRGNNMHLVHNGHAKALGLMNPDTAGPERLRMWANEPHTRLPRPWEAQVTRYGNWRALLE